MFEKRKSPLNARGQAMALLVTPVNLLVAEGFITIVAGFVFFSYALWLVMVNGAPLNGDVTVLVFLGMLTLGWGVFICYGAIHLQKLTSYLWAMAGAIAGIVPLLVGVYALVMLMNPGVQAGFAVTAAGITDDDVAV